MAYQLSVSVSLGRLVHAMRREYENNILGFVEECDRRIRAAQKRLEKTPEENNRTTALVQISLSNSLSLLISASLTNECEYSPAIFMTDERNW